MTAHPPVGEASPAASRSVLLVDDEPSVLKVVGLLFERYGWAVSSAPGGREALELYESIRPDLVVLDMDMPRLSGLEVLTILRERDPDATVIMLSGKGDIEVAVECLHRGAETFLSKPLLPQQLNAVVERAYEKSVLRRRSQVLASLQLRGNSLESLGRSAAMQEVAAQIGLLAPGNAPILLTGGTGSGKGWIARIVHGVSPRRSAPFVSINCAGLSAAFLDSELFGHEKGAFTDAKAQKQGLFEVANGGTLLLDEIGDLALELQPKLLTVLETQHFRRLGGTRERAVDVRLIAATHVDLAAAVRAGRFREDLFYRIAALPVRVPSLRERGREDVADLTLHLVAALRRQLGRGPDRISPDALELIVCYAWPGNVRELRNVLERALLLGANEPELLARHLPAELKAGARRDEPPASDLTLAAAERRHVERVLALVDGNRLRAAKELGISRQTLYNRLREYGADGD